jgi:DNA-binding MarR family transcriptional regulator
MSSPDLPDALFQLSFMLQAVLARLAAEHDLSPVQLRLLGILRDREPGMLELARYLDLEKSSLSGLVDRAEKRGFVERVPSEHDGRATTIRLTAKARKLGRGIEDAARAEVAKLLAPLPDADQKRLGALLVRVLSA